MDKKTTEESRFRRDQMAIKKNSLEEKAKLIRAQSLRGSSRLTSVSQSVSQLSAKVNQWLVNTEQPVLGNQENSLEPSDPTNLVLSSSFNMVGLTQYQSYGIKTFNGHTGQPTAGYERHS